MNKITLSLLSFVILLSISGISYFTYSKFYSLQKSSNNSKDQIDQLTKKINELAINKTTTTSTGLSTTLNSKDLSSTMKELNSKPKESLNISGTSKIDYSSFIPYVVLVVCNKSYGSGTIISPNKILTNFHVIEGNTECLVGFTVDALHAPNEWAIGTISAVDKKLDRALTTVNHKSANKTLKKCYSKDTKLSDELIVLGYPSVGGKTITLTNGIISGFITNYIKTSASINHGNSGGAAIHKTGCYLGIPTIYAADLSGLGYIIDERISDVNKSNDESLTDGSLYKKEIELQKQQEAELYKKNESEYKIFYNKVNSAYNMVDSGFESDLEIIQKYFRDKNFIGTRSAISKTKNKLYSLDTETANLPSPTLFSDTGDRLKAFIRLAITSCIKLNLDPIEKLSYIVESDSINNTYSSNSIDTYVKIIAQGDEDREKVVSEIYTELKLLYDNAKKYFNF